MRTTVLAITVFLLAGCSWFSDKKELDEAKTLPPLEVPPDLIRPYSEDKVVKPTLPEKMVTTKDCQCDDRPPRIGEAVLPASKGVQRLRDGQYHWLQVSVEPEQIWPLAKQFLEMRGYQVQKDEPAVGLMETDWKNRFETTDNTLVANLRERLRIRLEPGQQPESTEVFISQYSSERVETTDASAGEKWKLREQDNERAVEMLNRFARFLAAENVVDTAPHAPVKSRLDSGNDNGTVLVVEAGLEKAWRRTSIALDALGFVIEDQDRVNRIFHVYHEMPSGKTEEELKHGKPEPATIKEEYRVHLDQVENNTLVSVRDEAGQIDNSGPAMHLLNLLYGQFQ